MIWCNYHMRYEWWRDGFMYAWASGEVSKEDLDYMFSYILSLLFSGRPPGSLPHNGPIPTGVLI